MKIRKITRICWKPRLNNELCFLWVWVNTDLLAIVAVTEGGSKGTLTFLLRQSGKEPLDRDLQIKLRHIFFHETFPDCVEIEDVDIDEREHTVKVSFHFFKKGFCEATIRLVEAVVNHFGPSRVGWFTEGEIQQETQIKVGAEWITHAEFLLRGHVPKALGVEPA